MLFLDIEQNFHPMISPLSRYENSKLNARYI